MKSKRTNRRLRMTPGNRKVKPDVGTARHPQVRIAYGDWKADVDERLASFILMLWREGIETVMSCQDFVDGGQPGSAVVAFAKISDARAVWRHFGGRLSEVTYESDENRQAIADEYTGTAPEALIYWPTKILARLSKPSL